MKYFWLLVFVTAKLSAVELVLNGGFENLTSTVGSNTSPTAGIGYTPPWVSAGGSPDFYNNSTINFYGYSRAQQCFAGNSCAGMLNSAPLAGTNNAIQYEYLQQQLAAPMVAGTTYQLSMMVMFSDIFIVASPDLGMHLSTGNSFNQPLAPSFLPITLTPTMNNPIGGLLTNRNWVQFQASYVATGGEQYLTIGNFIQSPATMLPRPSTPHVTAGYYFLDNVSVIGPDAPTETPEPSTFFVTGAALVGVAVIRRRWRSAVIL